VADQQHGERIAQHRRAAEQDSVVRSFRGREAVQTFAAPDGRRFYVVEP